MNLEEIKMELNKLSTNELDIVIQFIKDNKLLNDYTSILIDAIEAKYNECIICPQCGRSHIKKNGHYKNGWQRYMCKDCSSTFSQYKGTIIENTKLHPIVWLKYMVIMAEDEDLRDCAAYAGVSLKASFYMRHKIMNAMAHTMDRVKLHGITELDEMSINISYSGNFKRQCNDVKELPRKAYQRGRKGNTHNTDTKFTDEIQIAGAVDRKGNIFLKVAQVSTTTLSAKKVKEVYKNAIENVKVLCTDGLFAYRELCKELKLEHHAFPKKSKEKRGIYHINHINYIHSRIREYLRRHPGISSKYLNEYLAYIAYWIKNKVRDIHDYFIDVYKYSCDFRRKNYIGTGLITDSIVLG